MRISKRFDMSYMPKLLDPKIRRWKFWTTVGLGFTALTLLIAAVLNLTISDNPLEVSKYVVAFTPVWFVLFGIPFFFYATHKRRTRAENSKTLLQHSNRTSENFIAWLRGEGFLTTYDANSSANARKEYLRLVRLSVIMTFQSALDGNKASYDFSSRLYERDDSSNIVYAGNIIHVSFAVVGDRVWEARIHIAEEDLLEKV